MSRELLTPTFEFPCWCWEAEAELHENDVNAQIEIQDGNVEGYLSHKPELGLGDQLIKVIGELFSTSLLVTVIVPHTRSSLHSQAPDRDHLPTSEAIPVEQHSNYHPGDHRYVQSACASLVAGSGVCMSLYYALKHFANRLLACKDISSRTRQGHVNVSKMWQNGEYYPSKS